MAEQDSTDKLTPNQRAWVEALRSGEFRQGMHYLTKGGRDCCLGVACKLAIKAGVPVITKIDDDGHVFYDGEESHLPTSVRDWLGLQTTGGYYAANDALTDDNDGGIPFAGIADIIETHADELFVGSPA